MKKIILHLLLATIVILSLIGLTYSGLNFIQTTTNHITYIEQVQTNTKQPIAYYSFDENNDTYVFDHSSNQKNGTIHGAVFNSSGLSRGAYTFDGVDDYINLSDIQLLTNQLTISLWVRPVDVANNRAYLISKYKISTNEREYAIFFETDSGDDYKLIIGNESGAEMGEARVDDKLIEDIPNNIWTHLAITRDNSEVKIYVNGKQKYIDVNTIPPDDFTDTGSYLLIGNSGDLDRPFNGSLDEIKIYNSVLTEKEITQIYEQKTGLFLEETLPTEKPKCDSNTIALYHFDDTTYESCNEHHQNFWSPALRFDGTDDYVNVSNLSLLRNRNAITVSAWIRIENITGAEQMIFASSYNDGGTCTGSSRFQFMVSPTGYMEIGGRSDDSETWQEIASIRPINTWEWYHVVGIVDYENDDARLFINGVEDFTTDTVSFTQTSTPDNDSACASVGADEDGADKFLDGIIDEVKVYDGILSDDDIYKLYKNQPIDESNLLLYYPFNDLSGATVTDKSQNSGHGTLLNFSDTSQDYGNSNDGGWANANINAPYVKGKFGNAISLNNANMLQIPYDSDFDLETFTISGWIRRDGDSGQFANIIYKGLSSTDRNFAMYVYNATDYLYVTLSSGGTQYDLHANTAIEEGKWCYFVFTHDDAGFMKIYIDGELKNTQICRWSSRYTKYLF